MPNAENLDHFFAHVRAGNDIEFVLASGESLDYPHVVMTYASGRAEIIAMADSETEAWRTSLTEASADDVDRAAGQALQGLKLRPFKYWKRAQLHVRVEAIRAEQRRLDAFRDDLDAQGEAIRGDSMVALGQRMRLAAWQSRRHDDISPTQSRSRQSISRLPFVMIPSLSQSSDRALTNVHPARRTTKSTDHDARQGREDD